MDTINNMNELLKISRIKGISFGGYYNQNDTSKTLCILMNRRYNEFNHRELLLFHNIYILLNKLR